MNKTMFTGGASTYVMLNQGSNTIKFEFDAAYTGPVTFEVFCTVDDASGCAPDATKEAKRKEPCKGCLAPVSNPADWQLKLKAKAAVAAAGELGDATILDTKASITVDIPWCPCGRWVTVKPLGAAAGVRAILTGY